MTYISIFGKFAGASLAFISFAVKIVWLLLVFATISTTGSFLIESIGFSKSIATLAALVIALIFSGIPTISLAQIVGVPVEIPNFLDLIRLTAITALISAWAASLGMFGAYSKEIELISIGVALTYLLVRYLVTVIKILKKI